MTTVTEVLKTIADDKSLVLFDTIALSNGDSDILLSTLELTRKQYYSRLSALLKAGLVKRERGKYSLTTFGLILYHTQEIIEEAVNQYWELKAMDSIMVSCEREVPQEELRRIVDMLIVNQEIKNILIKRLDSQSGNQEYPIYYRAHRNIYDRL